MDAATHPRSRWPAYVTLGVSVLLIGVIAWYWAVAVGWTSYWRNTRDYRAAPVEKTTLEQTGWRKYVYGGAWRDLPFTLSAAEERDVNAALHLANQSGITVDGKNQFESEAVHAQLDALVDARPGFFYAEHLLGTWLIRNGDIAAGEKLREKSLADAPVILVQPYTFPDGTPAGNLHIQFFSIECNRVTNASLNPTPTLRYFDLVTDEKGCIYLPAYKTVYRTDTMSYPTGMDCKYTSLGWFECPGKVGRLPVAVVSKR